MKLEEAVRIVRESMLPYNKDCSPRTVGDALQAVLAALEEAREEASQCDRWRDRFTAVSVAMGDRDGEVWPSTHDLPERVAALRRERDEARAEIERLREGK